MRIGEFAAALGLSVDTVRRLERRGLVFGQRDWCGHRRFSDNDVTRAREVLFARPSGRRNCMPPAPGGRPATPRLKASAPRSVPPRRGGQ